MIASGKIDRQGLRQAGVIDCLKNKTAVKTAVIAIRDVTDY